MAFIPPTWLIKTAHAALTLPTFKQQEGGAAPSLPQFISDLFDLSLAVVGLVIFGRIVYAGSLYIFSSSSGDATKAKKIITDAITGALILVSAYLILNVINPELRSNCLLLPDPGSGVPMTESCGK